MITAFMLAAVIAAISFLVGLYFRIAEYDVLQSEKVWDRIVPATQALIDDDDIPFQIAQDMTAFAAVSGCGCFVRAMVFVKFRQIRTRALNPGADKLMALLNNLPREKRHLLFVAFSDLVLFDSLHAPILGRICRRLHANKFAEEAVKETGVDEREQMTIVRIATTAESVIAHKGRGHGSRVLSLETV